MRAERKKIQWRPVDFLILAGFLAVLFLLGALLNRLWQGWNVSPGNVTVLTGRPGAEQRVEALRRVTHTPDGTEAPSLDPETDGERFPLLTLDGTVSLTTSEDPLDSMYYTFYDESFEELVFRTEQFRLPEEPGLYYLVIDTKWGNRKEYYTTEHGVRLRIP